MVVLLIMFEARPAAIKLRNFGSYRCVNNTAATRSEQTAAYPALIYIKT
jgi:hypothetical protein